MCYDRYFFCNIIVDVLQYLPLEFMDTCVSKEWLSFFTEFAIEVARGAKEWCNIMHKHIALC